MKTGKLGVFAFLDRMPAPESAAFARQVEEWGYGALWYPEARGRESLSQAAWLLAHTQRLVVASGIANIYARDAQASAAGRMALDELSGGRYLMGLGVSHPPLVEAIRGHAYGKPLQTMRAYLEGMHKALYDAPRPSQQGALVLAALRPGMLKLAAELTGGAHPYNVNPEHTRRAREILGPGKGLYVEQLVILESDPTRARERGRSFLSFYLKLENYRQNLFWLGFSQDEVDQVSDSVVDALVAWGDEARVRGRLQEHWEAGADHVCIQAIDAEGKTDRQALERLAPG